jgi:uncharacterized protein
MILMVDAPAPLAADEGSRQDESEPDERELTGPLRRCAVTRQELPIEDMVRFVAGPDAVVVPDLARRLPGRGVWVELSRVRIDEAVKRKSFSKSVKRPVTAPLDLADRIDALLVKRLLDGLSLANKAGLVVAGFAKVEAALDGGDVVALIQANDGAAGGSEKLDRKHAAIMWSRGLGSVVLRELTIDQISLAIGRSNVVHAAISQGGAATRLLEEARRLKRFRASPEPT